MNPANALVIAMASGDVHRIRDCIGNDPDWNRVVSLSHIHQVAGLCYWNARRLDQSTHQAILPPSVVRSWKSSFERTTLDNALLVNDILMIHDALAKRGVDFLVLKGLWLAIEAYPDPGLRQVGDIDICVHEHDYRSVVEALGACGYLSIGALPATPTDALRRAHFGEQMRFTAPRRRMVELHFRLINMGCPAIEESWVWETRRTIDVRGRAVRVPGATAMLLHVLLHSNQHGFAVLRLLHDTRWVLEHERERLDTAALLFRVRQMRCAASTYHGLLLARDLAGAAVPDELLRATRPSGWRRRLFEAVWQLRAVRLLESRRWPQSLESPLLFLLEIGDVRDRVRYIRDVTREGGGVVASLRRVYASFTGHHNEPGPPSAAVKGESGGTS